MKLYSICAGNYALKCAKAQGAKENLTVPLVLVDGREMSVVFVPVGGCTPDRKAPSTRKQGNGGRKTGVN